MSADTTTPWVTTILGQSKPIQELNKLIEKVAAVRTSVLIVGESGTGKELVARLIHDRSAQAGRPFVAVNCGAIPETLIESELFGHTRGSFTGAVGDKQGLFEVANSGTLFLDEIGELPLSMQVKLLRALQEKKIRRVGGVVDISIDARVLAATNRDLQVAITRGTFREDLYFRLNVIQIRTPPLREREGDIELLAHEFLKKFCAKLKKEIKAFDAEALEKLRAHSWPGNVRELENCVERAVALETHETIRAVSLPTQVSEGGKSRANDARDELALPVDLEKVLKALERAYLEAAIRRGSGKAKEVADLLGLSPKALAQKLSAHGMK